MAQLLSIFLDLNLLSQTKDLKSLPHPHTPSVRMQTDCSSVERFHQRWARWAAKTGCCYGEIEQLCVVQAFCGFNPKYLCTVSSFLLLKDVGSLKTCCCLFRSQTVPEALGDKSIFRCEHTLIFISEAGYFLYYRTCSFLEKSVVGHSIILVHDAVVGSQEMAWTETNMTNMRNQSLQKLLYQETFPQSLCNR